MVQEAKLSSGTFCRQSWWMPHQYLNMWCNPQLLTWDQSQWHFPASHYLNLIFCHSSQHHACWSLPQILYHNLWSPKALHSKPVIGVYFCLGWTVGEIVELRLQLFRAVGGYQLDGQRTVPTAGAAFLGHSAGPLPALTFRCAAGETIPFLMLEIKGHCKEWFPNWSTSCQNIQCRGNWRQSADPMCLAACWCQGSGALQFWSSDGSECFTHWACVTSTRLGSGREKTWKKPHWIGLTHLREDFTEVGIHLLSHPGPLVLLSLSHPESLVLIILGQPFQFEGQPPFKLSLGLGNFL